MTAGSSPSKVDVETYAMAAIMGAIANHVDRDVDGRTTFTGNTLARHFCEASQQFGEEIGVEGERTRKQRLWLARFTEDIKPAIARVDPKSSRSITRHSQRQFDDHLEVLSILRA